MTDSSPFGTPWNEEEILRRKESCDRLTAQIETLTRLRDADLNWLETVSAYLPPEARARIFGHHWSFQSSNSSARTSSSSLSKGEGRSSVWRDAIISALSKNLDGLTLREIVTSLEDSRAIAMHRQNPNGIYNATSRLVKLGTLVRYGDRFYLTEAFEKLVSAGEVDPKADPPRNKGTADIILDFLKKEGRALSPGKIMDKLREEPELAERIRKNPQYGYSVLGKMLHRGQVIKESGLYRLPKTNSEATSSEGEPLQHTPDPTMKDIFS